MLTSEFIAGCSVYVAQYGDVGQYSFFNLDLTGMGFDDPQMLTPYIQMRADSIKNEVYPDAGQIQVKKLYWPTSPYCAT